MRSAETADTIVIGGGQAGLAAAREFQRAGQSALVLEAHDRLGDNWRERWDGLRLFTPARYSSLPGLDFPAEPYHFPDRLEFANYLAAYAKTQDLDVVTGARVTRLALRPRDRGFRMRTADGRDFVSRRVVVASGAYRTPRLPGFAERLPPGMPTIHSGEVSNVDQWPGADAGKVLVVGAGASGAQLACLLSRKHEVVLAGRDPGALPRSVFGRDVYDYLFGLRLLRVPVAGPLARPLREAAEKGDVTVGESADELAARHGFRRCARIEDYDNGVFVTGDGQFVTGVGAVVFATGYANRYGFVHVPGALDTAGEPRHRAGVSPVRGLYWIGLPMLRTLSSALIGGVGADAEHLATHATNA